MQTFILRIIVLKNGFLQKYKIDVLLINFIIYKLLQFQNYHGSNFIFQTHYYGPIMAIIGHILNTQN